MHFCWFRNHQFHCYRFSSNPVDLMKCLPRLRNGVFLFPILLFVFMNLFTVFFAIIRFLLIFVRRLFQILRFLVFPQNTYTVLCFSLFYLMRWVNFLLILIFIFFCLFVFMNFFFSFSSPTVLMNWGYLLFLRLFTLMNWWYVSLLGLCFGIFLNFILYHF